MILLEVTIECNTGSHQYSQIVVAVVFQIRSDVTKGWDTYPWRKLNICLQAILEQHCHRMLVTNRHIIFLYSSIERSCVTDRNVHDMLGHVTNRQTDRQTVFITWCEQHPLPPYACKMSHVHSAPPVLAYSLDNTFACGSIQLSSTEMVECVVHAKLMLQYIFISMWIKNG